MREGLEITREDDGKTFKVVRHGHWSDVQASDGETDTIKYFDVLTVKGVTYDNYLSSQKGFSYLVPRR